MRLGILFSGGKDSTYAAWIARQQGHELACLISVFSKNKESFMFHTPAIEMTEGQAELMGLPLVVRWTKGEKEVELKDLEKAIRTAKEKYRIQGVVTGAVESIYQSSRIQRICDGLGIECFNPLWKRDQIELLEELIKNKFEVIIVGVFAYPLDRSWVGRRIDKKFIEEMKKLRAKYKISPSGEGGEFESFVVDCPLFRKRAEIEIKNISGKDNSWVAELAWQKKPDEEKSGRGLRPIKN